MFRRFAFAVLMVCSVTGAQAAGTLVFKTFHSDILNTNKSMGVYLPQGYDSLSTTRYPSIYFLHGWGGTHGSYWGWLRPALDTMIASGQIRPVIVVTPNGNCSPYAGSMWTNSELYGRYEDYLVTEVVSYVDTRYHTCNTPLLRGLAGHSMGAIGTMTVGLNNPGVFGALAGNSGYYNWDRIREEFRTAVLAENSGPPYNFIYGGATYTSALFLFAGGYSPNMANPPTYVDYPLDEQGNVVESVISRAIAHNPDCIAANHPDSSRPRIYFDCGDADEFFMYPTNFDLAAAFDSMGIEYEFRPFVGNHDFTLERWALDLEFFNRVMPDAAGLSEPDAMTTADLRLDLVWPNPCRGAACVRFRSVPGRQATLRLFDAQGRLVTTLLNTQEPGGERVLTWRPRDLPAGVYALELTDAVQRVSRKVVVTR